MERVAESAVSAQAAKKDIIVQFKIFVKGT